MNAKNLLSAAEEYSEYSRREDEFEALCSNGCRDAFVKFIQKLGVDRDTAEDIVQESLLCAWEQRSKFQGKSLLRTWLYGIGHKQLLRFRRHQWVISSLLERIRIIQETRNVVFDVADAFYPDEIIQILRERLSDDHFRVLYLDVCEQCSDSEISQKLGLPIGTIKSRLYHARQESARILTEAGYEIPISFL